MLGMTDVNQTESPVTASSGDSVNIYFEFSSSAPTATDVECTGPNNDAIDDMNGLGIVISRTDNIDSQLIRLEINITSVNHTHGGIYRCTANESVINATVLLLIRPEVEPMQALAKNGDNITLTCLAQSIPEPSYQWRVFKDSNDSDTISDVDMFVSGSGENMLLTRSFLAFEPVVYGDAGEYRCIIDIAGTQLESDSALLAGKPKVCHQNY